MRTPPQDDELDRDGQDSFPASDPPAHWSGPDYDPPPHPHGD
jgi:hypothetical protein